MDWLTEEQSREAIRAMRAPQAGAPWREWMDGDQSAELAAALEQAMQPAGMLGGFPIPGPSTWVCPNCAAVVLSRELHAAFHLQQAAILSWMAESILAEGGTP